MIRLLSGTPGSGKSLHAAKMITKLITGVKMDVIANFPIKMDIVTKNGKKQSGKFTYVDNADLTVDYLVNYHKENHELRKEAQTLVVIDEAGIMFNPRDYSNGDRPTWLKFMAQHRKFGYNIILIAQFDRQIDRQMRACIEYEVKHRKANNFGLIGLLLTLLRIPLFVAVTKWYGTNERMGAQWFTFNKKYDECYDTFAMFEKEDGELIKEAKPSPEAAQRTHRGGSRASGRDPGAPDVQPGQGKAKHYICREIECENCKHESYCKMAWKYLPMQSRIT